MRARCGETRSFNPSPWQEEAGKSKTEANLVYKEKFCLHNPSPKKRDVGLGGGAGRWESSSGLRFVDFCEVLLGYTVFFLSFGLIHQSFRRSRSCLSFEAGALFNSSCGATSLAPAGLKAETHCQSTAARIVSGGPNATSAGLMSSRGGDLSRLLQTVP